MRGERPTVLVVEDTEQLAEVYRAALPSEYEVVTVQQGESAIDYVESEGSVDAVLLERRLPDMAAVSLLERLAECDCGVGIVTALSPDFDVVDLTCDEYRVKPVTGSEIRAVTERLLGVATVSDNRRQLAARRRLRAVLRDQKTVQERVDSRRFQRLEAEIQRLETELDSETDELLLQ